MVVTKPYTRIEIFGEPLFFDDNHQKTVWTLTNATKDVSDGENLKLIASTTLGEAEHDLGATYNTSTYRYLVARISGFSGCTLAMVALKNGASIVKSMTFTGAGFAVLDLQAGGNSDFDAIYLTAQNSAGGYVNFDYVVICKKTDLCPVPEKDLMDDLEITLPLLNKAVNGAKFSIDNSSADPGPYNGKVSDKDKVIIWVSTAEADMGANAAKAFGGSITEYSTKAVGRRTFRIECFCQGYAFELDHSPELFLEYYVTTNGRTIIEEALAVAAYVAKHPTATSWFDNAGSSGSTDDRIDTDHDCRFDETQPMKAIREILGKAGNPDTPSKIGFVMRETPSGCLVGHLKNSLDFPASPAIVYPLKTYVKHVDGHGIINKQGVYGARDSQFPEDGDAAETLTGWTATYGTLSLLTVGVSCGTYFVNCQITGGPPYLVQFKRSFTQRAMRDGQKISFKAARSSAVGTWTSKKVRVLAPDASNYFERDAVFNLLTQALEEFDCGPNSTGWSSTGSPDWFKVTAIEFYAVNTAGYPSIEIDCLHIKPERNYGEAQDDDSIAAYGVRWGEPIIEDSLTSDLECEWRAQAIIDVSKASKNGYEALLLDGALDINAGDMVNVKVTHDALDDTVQGIEVKHKISRAVWTRILTIENEPQTVDYVKALVQAWGGMHDILLSYYKNLINSKTAI